MAELSLILVFIRVYYALKTIIIFIFNQYITVLYYNKGVSMIEMQSSEFDKEKPVTSNKQVSAVIISFLVFLDISLLYHSIYYYCIIIVSLLLTDNDIFYQMVYLLLYHCIYYTIIVSLYLLYYYCIIIVSILLTNNDIFYQKMYLFISIHIIIINNNDSILVA